MYWYSYDPARDAELYEARQDKLTELWLEERKARRQRGLPEPGEEDDEDEEDDENDNI